MENLVAINSTSIDRYRETIILEQEAAVEMAGAIIKIAKDRNMPAPKVSLDTITRGELRLRALRAGFLPAVGLSLTTIPNSPIKIKKGHDYLTWTQTRQKRVRAELKTLPPIIKEAITEAESMGIFKDIAISDPRAGGDPVIVGRAGGWNFLIASWVNLMDGQGIGFRFKLPEEVSNG